jgi:hypothetical protein
MSAVLYGVALGLQRTTYKHKNVINGKQAYVEKRLS